MLALYFINSLRLSMLEIEDDEFMRKNRPIKGIEMTSAPQRKSSGNSADSLDEDLNNSQTLL